MKNVFIIEEIWPLFCLVDEDIAPFLQISMIFLLSDFEHFFYSHEHIFF